MTHVEVAVTNFVTREKFTTNFIINSWAKDSILPASELRKIGIEPSGRRTYQLADGFDEYEFGFVEMFFLGEKVFGQVLFGPEDAEPLFGYNQSSCRRLRRRFEERNLKKTSCSAVKAAKKDQCGLNPALKPDLSA